MPDARTIWVFREALKAHELVDELFECDRCTVRVDTEHFFASVETLGQQTP